MENSHLLLIFFAFKYFMHLPHTHRHVMTCSIVLFDKWMNTQYAEMRAISRPPWRIELILGLDLMFEMLIEFVSCNELLARTYARSILLNTFRGSIFKKPYHFVCISNIFTTSPYQWSFFRRKAYLIITPVKNRNVREITRVMFEVWMVCIIVLKMLWNFWIHSNVTATISLLNSVLWMPSSVRF